MYVCMALTNTTQNKTCQTSNVTNYMVVGCTQSYELVLIRMITMADTTTLSSPTIHSQLTVSPDIVTLYEYGCDVSKHRRNTGPSFIDSGAP